MKCFIKSFILIAALSTCFLGGLYASKFDVVKKCPCLSKLTCECIDCKCCTCDNCKCVDCKCCKCDNCCKDGKCVPNK